MLRKTTTGLIAAGLAFAFSTTCRQVDAQTMMGSRGTLSSGVGFSTSSTGSSSMGMSGGMGSSGALGSSMGGMSSGMGMGAQGLGGQGAASGQLGMTPTNFGASALPSQQGGFVGQGNQGRFIGNTRVGAQQQVGGNTMGGAGNRNQLGGRNQAGGRNNQNGRGNNQGFGLNQNQFGQGGQNGMGGNNNNQQPRTVRPQQKVAFTYPQPKSDSLTSTINARFLKLSGRTSLKGLNIEVAAEGKAILSGQVETEDSRRLAERLVALEPGVRSVQNDLVVAPPEAKIE